MGFEGQGWGLGIRVGVWSSPAPTPAPAHPPNPPDYKKTSLAPYVRVFEQFVEGMESARRGERIRRSGECPVRTPSGPSDLGVSCWI